MITWVQCGQCSVSPSTYNLISLGNRKVSPLQIKPVTHLHHLTHQGFCLRREQTNQTKMTMETCLSGSQLESTLNYNLINLSLAHQEFELRLWFIFLIDLFYFYPLSEQSPQQEVCEVRYIEAIQGIGVGRWLRVCVCWPPFPCSTYVVLPKFSFAQIVSKGRDLKHVGNTYNSLPAWRRSRKCKSSQKTEEELVHVVGEW